jgi:hypothetical protein
MRYELWRHEDEAISLSFFAVDENYDLQRRLLEPGAEFIWAVEAETYNEAMARYHEFMGWEPYKPMDDGSPSVLPANND